MVTLVPLLLLLLLRAAAVLPVATTTTSTADVVAIVVDRTTLYPNGLHNGLLLGAEEFGLTLEIRTVGDFDSPTSLRVLQEAIDTPGPNQPRLYLIWPINLESKYLVQTLHQTHPTVPIIQLNQLPNEAWEFDSIVAYAGPDDALRARNAAQLLRQGLQQVFGDENNDNNEKEFNVVGLGYPDSYAGYHLSMNAFADSIDQDNQNGTSTTTSTSTTATTTLNLLQRLPLDWGVQPSYEATLQLFQHQYATFSGRHANAAAQNNPQPILHGIYAMDDRILLGVYQALQDLNIQAGIDVLVVGTVCNGARSLIEQERQYGTTIQSPLLEGKLALQMAHEYLSSNTTTTTNTTTTKDDKDVDVDDDETLIRFTPNPSATSETWDSMFVDFLGRRYTSDGLCTWTLFYQREAGPTGVESVDDFCEIATCEYIPRALFIAGYVLVATNYGISALCLFLMYVYRRQEIIRVAQPFFLALVVVGTIVDTTSIIFMSRDNRDYSVQALDRACLTWPILLSVGHMMTTATLAAKIYRVKRLVDAGLNFRRVQVSVAQVSLFILLFVALDVIVLLVWFTTDPFRWTLKESSTDLTGYVNEAFGQCASEGDNYWVYPMAIAVLHVSVLLYANYLAYKTARYHAISDAKSVAICLFNSIQLLLIGAPILALVGDNIATSYLIRIGFVFLNNFGVLVIIVCPKVLQCLRGNGNKQDYQMHVHNRQTGMRRSESNYSNYLVENIRHHDHSAEMGLHETNSGRVSPNSPSGLRSRSARSIGSGESAVEQNKELIVSFVIEEGNEEESDLALSPTGETPTTTVDDEGS
mmetsp:Transcript_11610/g.32144  ORF Transcript_11610/g.32144 Transcript_11610/m.32144 type:complete len:812 (+) Transcript_11610:243-2678(+)